MKTTLQLAFFICSLFFISTSTSRAQLPCSCVTRWTGGDEWGANGTLIQNPHPGGGVVRCANSAETEAQVKPICPYDAAAFPISTTYGAPKNGQKIAWFNFDAQANAGTFEWQIVSNDDMAYALYRSTVSTTALKNNLSGDCSQLEYVGCGTDFNGWKDFPFVNSEFPGKATNYYMLFWDKTPTGPSGDNFDLRFKARRGCSDNIPCSIKSDLTKPNTVACTNGKYQACFFVEGFNGNFKVATTPAYETVSVVYTNENGTISTDPTPTEITFGCTAGMGLKAQLCFTFPTSIYPTASSVSLQLLGTKTVCGTSTCGSSLSASVPLKKCCQLVIDCGDMKDKTFCRGQILPDDSGLIKVLESCSGTTQTTFIDQDNGGTGCKGSPLLINRTYTVTDVATGETQTCTQVFSYEFSSVFSVISPRPVDLVLDCMAEIPPSTDLIVKTTCRGEFTVKPTEKVDLGMNCATDKVLKTITRTWLIESGCGYNSEIKQVIKIKDDKAPTFSVSDKNLTCDTYKTFIASPTKPVVSDFCSTTSLNWRPLAPMDCKTHTLTLVWTAADGCGNTTTKNQVITLDVPEFSALSVASCPTLLEGQITVAATGGCLPYNYQYQYPNGTVVESISNVLKGLTNGFHTVTAKDGSGCQMVQQVELTCVDNSIAPSPENGKTASFTLFPTPSDGVVNLDLKAYSGETVEVQVFNMFSKSVYYQKIQGVVAKIMTLDFLEFPEGAYIVSVKSESKKPFAKVLIINKM